jgi:hypothetical protein
VEQHPGTRHREGIGSDGAHDPAPSDALAARERGDSRDYDEEEAEPGAAHPTD